LEIQKNKLCRTEIENSRDLYNYYKFISNLPFINPIYIKDIYKIKNEYSKSKYVQFMEFLKYFENTYLDFFKIEYWNYYDNIEHITNNASESYNNYLNNLFVKNLLLIN